MDEASTLTKFTDASKQATHSRNYNVLTEFESMLQWYFSIENHYSFSFYPIILVLHCS